MLNLAVVPEDKYAAMPLTDIRGRRLRWMVYAPPGKRLVQSGKLAVYEMRAKRRQKREQRVAEANSDDE